MVVPPEDVAYFKATGDIEGTASRIATRQAMKPFMMNGLDTDLLRAKCGKLPKYSEGGWGNAIISGLGGLAALS